MTGSWGELISMLELELLMSILLALYVIGPVTKPRYLKSYLDVWIVVKIAQF